MWNFFPPQACLDKRSTAQPHSPVWRTLNSCHFFLLIIIICVAPPTFIPKFFRHTAKLKEFYNLIHVPTTFCSLHCSYCVAFPNKLQAPGHLTEYTVYSRCHCYHIWSQLFFLPFVLTLHGSKFLESLCTWIPTTRNAELLFVGGQSNNSTRRPLGTPIVRSALGQLR